MLASLRSEFMRFRLSVALALSGAGSVGAQVVWSKLFAQGLGHEMTSVVSVVCAVMFGFAGGAFLWKPTRFSACPLRALLLLELAIGLGVAVSAAWIPAACAFFPKLISVGGSDSIARILTFCLPLITLLPMTLLMGATLPAMEASVSKCSHDERVMGWTYSCNTAGAMFGAVLAAFVLMPKVGFARSLLFLALCHGAASVLLWRLETSAEIAESQRPNPRIVPRMANERSAVSMFRLWFSLAATGFLGLGVEVVGMRGLSMVFENTVYSFAIALACFLGATAVGAWLHQRFLRSRHPVDVLAWLFPSMASGVLIGASFLPRAWGLFEWTTEHLGRGVLGIWTAEVTLGLAVFVPCCVAAGATFSHLVQLARNSSRGVARATALNFLGGALGAPLFGLWLLPSVGYKWSCLAIAFGYLVLIPHPRTWSAAISLLLASVVWMLPEDLRLIKVPPGAELIAWKTGSLATVSVLSDSEGQRSLRVNNRFQMGGTSASVAQRRQAHIPLLIHSNPHSALFLGTGTGITLGAATTYEGLRIDAVELVPEIVGFMDRFESANRAPQRNPNVRIHVADARSFLRRSQDRYDLVIADLFHPAQDGSGSLYTREHFQSIRDRLNPGGLFCQWLPLHQLDTEGWQSIAATFQSVFANTELWWLHFNMDIPVLGLVGRLETGAKSEWSVIEERMKQADAGELRSAGFANPIQLLGCRILGPDFLYQLTHGSPLNLDSFPFVSFATPKVLARDRAEIGSPVLTLLDRMSALRSVPTKPDVSGSGASELTAFALARDHYLRGMALEARADLSAAMDRYFDSVTASLHFTPAYARLVGVIRVMASADPARARSLYERLLKARPDQPLGKKLLGPLFDPSDSQ